MPDVTEKAANQASKPSGPRAPGQAGGSLIGPNPVLNNAWGNRLAEGNKSSSMKGGKK